MRDVKALKWVVVYLVGYSVCFLAFYSLFLFHTSGEWDFWNYWYHRWALLRIYLPAVVIAGIYIWLGILIYGARN